MESNREFADQVIGQCHGGRSPHRGNDATRQVAPSEYKLAYGSTPSITPPYAIEIVHYRLIECANPDRFLDINRVVGAEFSSTQPGFLCRAIGRSDDGRWLVAVYWKTSEHAHASIGNIEKIPASVRSYMAQIDSATLTRSIFEVV